MKTCILFAFILADCNSTHYDLELTPDGKQMQRRLSTANTLSETHITHLKQLYPKYRVEQHGDVCPTPMPHHPPTGEDRLAQRLTKIAKK